MPASTRGEVESVYVCALQTVWQVAIAFSLLGFLLVFGEKHVELRTELQTEFGLDEGNEKTVEIK